MQSQVVSVNFSSLHRKVEFNYELDLEKLPKPLQQFRSDLESFTPEELQYLRWRMVWKSLARQKQLPPKEFDQFLKDIWIIRSGRGFGKTLAGSNWLGIEGATYPSMYCVVAPTKDDVRYTCFEGPTGLYAVIPPQLIVDKNLALPSITLWNGSIIRGFAGDAPERLRGPQHAAGWLDEIASWMYPDDAWDNLQFGLRLGPHPRLCVTGTPKPSIFIRDLMKRTDVIITVGSTYENRENLTASYFKNVAKYEGTKIGRQEIHGEVLDPEESGWVKRSQWRMWPNDKALPKFQFVLMSLDTAFTEEQHDKGRRVRAVRQKNEVRERQQENDPSACTVWGLFKYGTPPVYHVMLLDAWQEWLGFPQLIKRVKTERLRRYGEPVNVSTFRGKPMIVGPYKRSPQGKKIDVILIETKSSGISLIQSLAAEEILAEGYDPGDLDKLARLHVVSPLWSHGRVWAIESDQKPREFRNWAEPVISQVCTYSGEGSLKHDDLLDTSTQGLKTLMDNFIGALTIPKDPEAEKLKAQIERAKQLKLKSRESPYG